MASTIGFKTQLWTAAGFVIFCSVTFCNAVAESSSTLDAVEKAAPQGRDPPGADEQDQAPPSESHGENLSKQLNRNKGVIAPPSTGDSEIYTDAPNPNPGTTPVIPPPGTPGGDQSVEPR